MEEQDWTPSMPAYSSSLASRNGEFSGAASTSTSSRPSHVREGAEAEHENYDQPPRLLQQQITMSYHANYPITDNEALSLIRDDTWSCVIVVLTFWFFVSLTLILGVYGSVNLPLGPNSSLLIKPSPIFVEYVKVELLDNSNPAPMLYGFYNDPPLEVVTTWSETHIDSLTAGSHKDRIYFLNEGSQINISYSVNSSSSSSLILIIAKGNEGLAQWLENPSYPNTTLSWNIIHGNGKIQQDIFRSSSYYVAVGNLNSEEVELQISNVLEVCSLILSGDVWYSEELCMKIGWEGVNRCACCFLGDMVQLNLKVRAFLYNTTEAYYKCTLDHGQCSLKLFFPNGNAVVLATSAPKQGTDSNERYLKLSYGPRWIAYLVGIGGLTVLMLLAFHFLNNFRCTRDDGTTAQFGGMGSERVPLLSHKDDDLSSWGSSYDSVSQDDEDPEDGLAVDSLEGKPLKDGEYNNNTRRLCAICFDAPRDCFFLPCGHCVACFACGTRIAEASGTCPICRRNMKKVRKIFTV